MAGERAPRLLLLLIALLAGTGLAQRRGSAGAVREALQPQDAGEELPDRGYQGLTCEGSSLTLSCGGGKVLKVLRANYGRLSMKPCPDLGGDTANWNTQCMSTRALSIVNQMCTGRVECRLPASNRLFGDPCPDTPKYLQAKFKCVEENGSKRTPPPLPEPPRFTTTTTTDATTTTTTTTTTEKPAIEITPDTTTTTSTSSTTPAPEEPEPEVLVCEQTTVRRISWPHTKNEKTVYRKCPNNQNARAWWRCGSDGRWQGHPDLSLCVSPMLADMGRKVTEMKTYLDDATTGQDPNVIAAKEAAASQIVEEVAAGMIKVSQDEVFGGDLDGISRVMESMVNQIDTRALNVSKPRTRQLIGNVSQAVVKSGSNLLDKKQKEAWQDLPQASQAQAATRVINSVETSAFKLADTCTQPDTIVNVQLNIVLEVNVVSTRADEVRDVQFPGIKTLDATSDWAAGNSIRLSANTIKEYGVEGLAKLIFATYQNLEELLQPQADRPQQDASTAADRPAGNEISAIQRQPDTADPGHDRFNTIGELPELAEVEVAEVELAEQVVNTQVISASINGRKETKQLAEPVYYTLEHKSTNNIYNPTCSFWEYEERTMTGQWSTFGCELVDTNVTHSTCACSHMTNFAVLMDVSATALTPGHSLSLQLLTYIGCLVSIVCLFVAILTFHFIKNLQCDRNTIHKNLCLCLFIAQVVFLAGIVQHDKGVLCSIVAGVLHYFLLAAFLWMFVEGLQLYVMLIEVFEAEKSRRLYYYILAYGIPAIIVSVAAGVFPHGYGTDKHCWLTTERGFIWAFVGPVIVVISVNIVMLSIAIYKMCEHARNVSSWKMKERSRMQSISGENPESDKTPATARVELSWIKGAVVLVVLLGLTWSLGLLYFNDHAASLMWAYVFTVTNSLQGAFIFLFHCLLNEKVQKEYKKIARRTSWLPDCIRVNYGGAKSYTSSTPNNSSSGNALQKLLSSRFRKRSSTSSIINKSTSSTPGRWNWQDANNSAGGAVDSGVQVEANGSAIYSEPTEDPGGYLEPVSLRLDSGLDYEQIHGEPLSNLEGSVVDSDFMADYCKPPPINVDKYKIGAEELPLARPEESDDDDCCKKACEAYEASPLVSRKLTLDEIDDEMGQLKEKLKRLSSDSGNVDVSSSLNDLNKEDSDGSTGLIAPNIAATLKRDNREAGPSEAVAIDKLKKALSASSEGLISLYHGKKPEHRLSRDSQEALDKHHMRISSSDC